MLLEILRWAVITGVLLVVLFFLYRFFEPF